MTIKKPPGSEMPVPSCQGPRPSVSAARASLDDLPGLSDQHSLLRIRLDQRLNRLFEGRGPSKIERITAQAAVNVHPTGADQQVDGLSLVAQAERPLIGRNGCVHRPPPVKDRG